MHPVGYRIFRDALCREAIRQDRPLLDLLSENAAITKHVDRKKLSELCDPSNYLGLSAVMVDRVLDRLRDARAKAD